jgi:hypothetical protein
MVDIPTTAELNEAVCSKIGVTKEQLAKMDIGDIERSLDLRFDSPHHPLYTPFGPPQRINLEKAMTKILGERNG